VIGGADGATGVGAGWSLADTGSVHLFSDAFDATGPGSGHFDLQVRGRFPVRSIPDTSFASVRGFGAIEGANILVSDTKSDPLPGTMLLIGSGVLGVAVWGRRRRRMQD
jgi:hypothetical protein